LSACSSGGKNEPSASPTVNPLDKVEWVDGDNPELDFEVPFALGQASAWRVAEDGDGPQTEPGQRVSLDYVAYRGADASVVDSTYSNGKPTDYQLATETSSGDIVSDALTGHPVGSKVIVAWQAGAAEAESPAATESEAAAPEVYLMAVTIVAILANRAEGETIKPDNPDLPVVTLDDSGKPSIEIPQGVDPPTELVKQVLIQGDGAAVTEDSTVVAQYTGWLWDGTQFDSSWDNGAPSTFSLERVIKGWTQGLTGVAIGSQVLLVIPPELGYGADGQGEVIPGDATLIFVVDILDAERPVS
jgi:peptidylprolyl isomerase